MKKTVCYLMVIVAFITMTLWMVYGIAEPHHLAKSFGISALCITAIALLAYKAKDGEPTEKSRHAGMFATMSVLSLILLLFGGAVLHWMATA